MHSEWEGSYPDWHRDTLPLPRDHKRAHLPYFPLCNLWSEDDALIQGDLCGRGLDFADPTSEVTFSCMFVLWCKPVTELGIWPQHKLFRDHMGHPVVPVDRRERSTLPYFLLASWSRRNREMGEAAFGESVWRFFTPQVVYLFSQQVLWNWKQRQEIFYSMGKLLHTSDMNEIHYSFFLDYRWMLYFLFYNRNSSLWTRQREKNEKWGISNVHTSFSSEIFPVLTLSRYQR